MTALSDARARDITEKELQDLVTTLARFTGWKHYHTHDSRRSPAGFPDLVLAKAGHAPWFWELKTMTGGLSTAQREWLAALGPRALVVRPDAWLDGSVARMLTEEVS